MVAVTLAPTMPLDAESFKVGGTDAARTSAFFVGVLVAVGAGVGVFAFGVLVAVADGCAAPACPVVSVETAGVVADGSTAASVAACVGVSGTCVAVGGISVGSTVASTVESPPSTVTAAGVPWSSCATALPVNGRSNPAIITAITTR